MNITTRIKPISWLNCHAAEIAKTIDQDRHPLLQRRIDVSFFR